MEECAEQMQGAGFEYFAWNKIRAFASCRGCVAGTEDTGATGMVNSLYKVKPNYPVALQDPADNKQCITVAACTADLPWDYALGASGKCMADTNVKEVKCKINSNGFIEKVNFQAYDGSA